MDFTLKIILELGNSIGLALKGFANFLLMPIYDLPSPPVGATIWRGFLSLVRLLDPTDSISIFVFFISFGLVFFITITIIKWIADIVT